ncbi:MAG TPA: cytochrome P450 [Steroidobacteraceae bacterium]|nr:cytochrome P450 [Steroidobacteraceae bacterium]
MESHSHPKNVIAAPTAANPYPYYAQLIERTPFYRDASLGFWVASSAAAVSAVLASDICRVRPVSEPVPVALIGSPAAEIFRQLIRMNDGAGHCPFNRAVAATLGSIDATRIAERSAYWAALLVRTLAPNSEPAQLNRYTFELSTHVMGDLLGLPHQALSQISDWIGDFVRCVFSGTAEQVEQGKLAAGQLLDLFKEVLISEHESGSNGLLFALQREGLRVGRADTGIVLANAIGFLSQAFEATAGLIGNSLVALSRNRAVRNEVTADRTLLPGLVAEVLRHDPPSHNTRRFVAANGFVFDQAVNSGDTILVVLAAANRDPAANTEPDLFDLKRINRKVFTFGSGIHACPGDTFGMTIAMAGIAALLDSGLQIEHLRSFSYRASANTRIPIFAKG